MAKRITGKSHVGERRERRPNGDIYIYERIPLTTKRPKRLILSVRNSKEKSSRERRKSFPPVQRNAKVMVVCSTQFADTLVLRIYWSGSVSPPALTMTYGLHSARATRPRFFPSRDTGSPPTAILCHVSRVGR